MHVLTDVGEWEEWAGPGSLDFGKNKSREWWGLPGSSCGGCVACRDVDGVRTYVPVMCKRWVCDVCGYYRYAWLVRNIAECIESDQLRVMWTLTLSTVGRTPEGSWDDMQAAWRKLLE